MSTIERKWKLPSQATDLDIAFSASPKVPEYEDIPRDFDNADYWKRFQSAWFFNGNVEGVTPKDGIDPRTALRHLASIQSTFSIKHEHKELAVAWLASLWFEEWFAKSDSDS